MTIGDVIDSFTEDQANVVMMLLEKQAEELRKEIPEYLVTYSRRCFDNTVQLRLQRMSSDVLSLFRKVVESDDNLTIIEIKPIGGRRVC